LVFLSPYLSQRLSQRLAKPERVNIRRALTALTELEQVNDRTAELDAAVRAQDALIAAAQAEVERYLVKQIEAQELVDRLIRRLDGPQQREVQLLARQALGEDFSDNA
jgi:hypothetical protein